MKAEIFLFDMETKKDNFISLSVKMSNVILYLAALSKCHIIFNCIIWVGFFPLLPLGCIILFSFSGMWRLLWWKCFKLLSLNLINALLKWNKEVRFLYFQWLVVFKMFLSLAYFFYFCHEIAIPYVLYLHKALF